MAWKRSKMSEMFLRKCIFSKLGCQTSNLLYPVGGSRKLIEFLRKYIFQIGKSSMQFNKLDCRISKLLCLLAHSRKTKELSEINKRMVPIPIGIIMEYCATAISQASSICSIRKIQIQFRYKTCYESVLHFKTDNIGF